MLKLPWRSVPRRPSACVIRTQLLLFALVAGPLSAGDLALGSELKTPLQSVKVTIGGRDALVPYAGSAGAAVAGLFQVNAVVPRDVAPGSAVPVTISVGGVPSQGGVTIAVQ